MKKGPDGFWHPPNQSFDFRPLIFHFRNNQDWCAWQSERMSTCFLVALTNYAKHWSHFKYQRASGEKQFALTNCITFNNIIKHTSAFLLKNCHHQKISSWSSVGTHCVFLIRSRNSTRTAIDANSFTGKKLKNWYIQEYTTGTTFEPKFKKKNVTKKWKWPWRISTTKSSTITR